MLVRLMAAMLALATGRDYRLSRRDVRPVATAILRATQDLEMALAMAAVGWVETLWGIVPGIQFGCGRSHVGRTWRQAAACAEGTLARARRRCGSWEEAFTVYNRGGRCRVNGYGRTVAAEMQRMACVAYGGPSEACHR